MTREIQGHSASEALDLLAFSPKKAALLVKKTLKSAIANAENNAELKVDTLLLGWGQNDDNLHGPNEKFCLADFHRGIKASAHLLQELAGAS